MRKVRNGDPLAGGIEPGTPKRTFDRLVKLNRTSCIEWPHARIGGYGTMKLAGKPMRVHRLALLITTGNPPDGKPCALHLCDNPSCFNPRHLQWGSVADNSAQMVERQRQYRGTRHHLCRLTEADVIAIRASEQTQTALAKFYGVTQAAVSAVQMRKTWSWL